MPDEIELKHLFMLAFAALVPARLDPPAHPGGDHHEIEVLGHSGRSRGPIFFLCNWLLGFVLVEANWGIVWSARVQLFAGHEMNFRMVSDGQENQMWRLWATLALLTAVVSSAYGTSEITTRNFVGGFLLLSIVALAATSYPGYRSYNPEGPARFALVGALGLASF